jgi:putative oxidoreductase
MKNLDQCRRWLWEHEDGFRDLVRIYLGIGLFFKGVYFMSHPDDLNQLLQRLDSGAFAQAMAAHWVIPIHLLGGALLAVGLLTRVAALAQIPVLLGAVLYVYLPRMTLIEPRQNLEFSLLVLFLLVLVFLFGAGRFSLDHKLARRHPEELRPTAAA